MTSRMLKPGAEFILTKDGPRQELIDKLVRFIHKLPSDKPWRLTIQPYKKKRSNDQNAYLWGCVYPTILDAGGESLQGWTNDDLHDYFLGEHFGWETIEGFGRKRIKPLKRSSKLSTTKFIDFVAFIQNKCAELGIYIPDPNEESQDATNDRVAM